MARLMSSTELSQRMEEDEDFVLVDVREEDEYQEGHIEGARSIPLENLKENAEELLNKNQRVVVYGNNHDTPESNSAAKLLETLGFRKVSDFDGGTYAWIRAGFHLTTDEADEAA
ncbi:MAG: rhodanese-like domain-containing protein [Bradymonadaceae bacterium]